MNWIPKVICVAGKNDIAVEVLLYLKERYDFKLCVVCNRTENGKNTHQKSLRWFADNNGIEELKLEDVYKIEGLIFLSMEYDRIIKPERFYDAKLYNIHFSNLPKYKGVYTSVFPILNGEKYAGVTIHEIDQGIDTGSIIDQKVFPIKDFNCRDLYYEYEKIGTSLVKKNLDRLIKGDYTATPQRATDSTYYGKKSIDYQNLSIDCNQTAEGISRQIRAFGYREYQLPEVNGHIIMDAYITDIPSVEKSGSVLYENENGIMMSCIDYNVFLYFDRFDELMDACSIGDIQKVRDICIAKRHANEQDEHGWTPLIVATYNNHKDIVKYLISIGADIRCKNNNGTNLLMYAKEAYKNQKDDGLFTLYYRLGLSLDDRDYYGKSTREYMMEEGIVINIEESKKRQKSLTIIEFKGKISP